MSHPTTPNLRTEQTRPARAGEGTYMHSRVIFLAQAPLDGPPHSLPASLSSVLFFSPAGPGFFQGKRKNQPLTFTAERARSDPGIEQNNGSFVLSAWRQKTSAAGRTGCGFPRQHNGGRGILVLVLVLLRKSQLLRWHTEATSAGTRSVRRCWRSVRWSFGGCPVVALY